MIGGDVLEAGKLRNRIIIQQRSTTKNSFGETIDTWTTFTTLWAAIEPLRGREFFESKETQAEVTTKITIRNKSGITPQMRVSWNSKIFDIKSIINIESRNKEVILMCQELI